MEELINRGRDLTGPKVYIYEGYKIEVSESFIYEVCINKYWKNGYCLLNRILLKSSKPLKSTNTYKYIDTGIIEREIHLISAPYTFIKEKNLPIYNNIKRKIKKK